MEFQQQIDYWRQSSEDDLEAAESLFNNHKFRQALFFIHLSIEKILKSHVVKNTRDVPPRIHDLLRLANLSGLKISDLQRKVLSRFQFYCLEGRYPDFQPSPPSEKETQNELNEARSIYLWLANQLK
ncbi:MAG: HEPN domain-containing protein [Thermoguttaceae bacterium]|jgi:HEPN domain-containing protein